MVSSRAGKWSESPSRDYVIDNAAQHLQEEKKKSVKCLRILQRQ